MLSFLCDPTERHLPMHERTTIHVCHGPKRIATLSAVDDESVDRSESTAMWTARVHHKQFDPFMHDHEPNEEETNVHVAASEEGLVSLHNPAKMDISSARQWVRDVYTGAKE